MKRKPGELKEAWQRFCKLSQTEKELYIEDRWISTVAGRTLSYGNICMILHQNPKATIVGGRNQWKEVGRTIRDTEKTNGLLIWIPYYKKVSDDEESKLKFKTAFVYDIEQTERKDNEDQV